jgi:putative ABC transport system substrate-binding protein
MSSLQMMAQSIIRRSEIALTLSIGTAATQAITSIETQKPIVFAAVTDPSILKVNLDSGNVYGISDAVSAQAQMDLIRAHFPTAQKIGLIFNPSEPNSLYALKKLQEAISKLHLESFPIGIQSSSEVPAMVESAVRKCDLILAPTDNLVAMSMPLIAKITRRANIPLVASDLLLC